MFLLYIPTISVILCRGDSFLHEVVPFYFEQLHFGALFKAPLTLKSRYVLTLNDRKLGHNKTTLVSRKVDDCLLVRRLE